MAELNVSDLDFDTIKENLKGYLNSQTEFSDYNFDGSGLSILLDILAYNTHYNATLAHLAANEMFLDSAVKRGSVVSIAKSMGYTPRSMTSAKAVLDIIITPSTSYNSTSLTLEKTVGFSAAANGKVYTFYPKTSQTAQKINEVFTFYDVEVVEGSRLKNTFTIDQATLSGPLVIPNLNVDKSSFKVIVQESASTPTVETYSYYDSILDVDSTSKVFYVDENPYGLYEIRFGDGVVSKQLTVGNIVTVEYIVSNGPAANYISAFSMNGNLTGSGETKQIFTNVSAAGGANAESIESIRLNAPLYNAAKNRAVTANDYSALIKSRFDNVNSVMVWGGEENDPPVYGKVFVSIDPLPNSIITASDKDFIVREIIKPRSVVSIQTEFVDPIYHYLTVNATVRYDRTVTTATSATIQSAVDAAVRTYFTENLNALEKNFYYTDLIKYIQRVSSAIFSVSIDLKLHRRIGIYEAAENVLDLVFNTEVEQNSFRSSNFFTTIGSASAKVYLTDRIDNDPLSTTGDIVARRVDTDEILLRNVGTINYTNGKIQIPSIFITSTVDEFRFYVTPAGTAPDVLTVDLTRIADISTAAVFPLAARNTVLKLDDSGGNTLENISAGLIVNAIQSVGK